jgi:hypothetical protein
VDERAAWTALLIWGWRDPITLEIRAFWELLWRDATTELLWAELKEDPEEVPVEDDETDLVDEERADCTAELI